MRILLDHLNVVLNAKRLRLVHQKDNFQSWKLTIPQIGGSNTKT